jgi:hypothetical protein
MSLFDGRALREIVAEELRRVLREELTTGSRPANDSEYLPVAEAAARASVAPGPYGSGWLRVDSVDTTPAARYASAARSLQS